MHTNTDKLTPLDDVTAEADAASTFTEFLPECNCKPFLDNGQSSMTVKWNKN